MRLLLHETLGPALVDVLRSFGHEAEHVNPNREGSMPESSVFTLAREFDALLVADRGSREEELIAIYREALLEDVTIVIISLSPKVKDMFRDVAKILIARIEVWVAHVADSNCACVVVNSSGQGVHPRTRENVSQTIAAIHERMRQRSHADTQ